MGVYVKKGNDSLSFYRIISNEVRKSIYQGVPGKRNDGEGKGLQPPDVGFHLLRSKKGLGKRVKGRIGYIDRNSDSTCRSWDVPDRRFTSTLEEHEGLGGLTAELILILDDGIGDVDGPGSDEVAHHEVGTSGRGGREAGEGEGRRGDHDGGGSGSPLFFLVGLLLDAKLGREDARRWGEDGKMVVGGGVGGRGGSVGGRFLSDAITEGEDVDWWTAVLLVIAEVIVIIVIVLLQTDVVLYVVSNGILFFVFFFFFFLLLLLKLKVELEVAGHDTTTDSTAGRYVTTITTISVIIDIVGSAIGGVRHRTTTAEAPTEASTLGEVLVLLLIILGTTLGIVLGVTLRIIDVVVVVDVLGAVGKGGGPGPGGRLLEGDSEHDLLVPGLDLDGGPEVLLL